MKVFVHYPNTNERMAELQNRVTKIHTGAVINYIMKLTCPLEQKIKLVQSIQDTIRSGQKN